jgi:hypothetical protein
MGAHILVMTGEHALHCHGRCAFPTDVPNSPPEDAYTR